MALLAAACGDGGDTATPPTSDDTSGDSTTSLPGDSPSPSVALISDAARQPADSDAPQRETAAAFNRVGYALLAEEPVDENIVFSPSSIAHALLMARAAADDATAAAIDAFFAWPDGMAAHDGWNAIDQAIAAAASAEDEVTVAIADRLWPRRDVTPDQEWLDLLASHHGADTVALDFAGDPVGSRNTINDWVAEQTEELIPELLPEGFIQPQMVLVLTDALYFKAQWQTVFGKNPTGPGTFTKLDGSTVTAEFMRELGLGDMRGSGDGYVGAEIPYRGNEFSMLVIVPDEGRFEEIRNRLDGDLLAEIDGTFTTGPYELLLPKWEDDSAIDLLGFLEQIGAAPGSYPAISPDAFLGAAVHAADIAVDEWGTVAAAATALGFLESAPPAPELVVAADRPFFYLIRHRDSGLVLFMGQVTDPTAS